MRKWDELITIANSVAIATLMDELTKQKEKKINTKKVWQKQQQFQPNPLNVTVSFLWRIESNESFSKQKFSNTRRTIPIRYSNL